MADNVMKILEMLKEENITVDEAERLLSAVEAPQEKAREHPAHRPYPHHGRRHTHRCFDCESRDDESRRGRRGGRGHHHGRVYSEPGRSR